MLSKSESDMLDSHSAKTLEHLMKLKIFSFRKKQRDRSSKFCLHFLSWSFILTLLNFCLKFLSFFPHFIKPGQMYHRFLLIQWIILIIWWEKFKNFEKIKVQKYLWICQDFSLFVLKFYPHIIELLSSIIKLLSSIYQNNPLNSQKSMKSIDFFDTFVQV